MYTERLSPFSSLIFSRGSNKLSIIQSNHRGGGGGKVAPRKLSGLSRAIKRSSMKFIGRLIGICIYEDTSACACVRVYIAYKARETGDRLARCKSRRLVVVANDPRGEKRERKDTFSFLHFFLLLMTILRLNLHSCDYLYLT